MFVMTAKLSKPKLIAAGVILLGVIMALVMLLSGNKSAASTLPAGDSNEARAAYLATYGWSIDVIPTETQAVTIPDPETNRVFARYNEMQTSQGFDLLPYKGKEVTRFVYRILNYPEATAPVYAGVLVYEGKIIGGEITNTAPEGAIHGFRKPGTAPDTLPQTEADATQPQSSTPGNGTDPASSETPSTGNPSKESTPSAADASADPNTSADAAVTQSASDVDASAGIAPDEAANLTQGSHETAPGTSTAAEGSSSEN